MKKIVLFLMSAFILATAASCSKDDEPAGYEPTYDGVSVYMNAIQKLYENGQPAYTPTDQAGVYVASADSYDAVYAFIANLIGNPKWDGKDVTIKLGENGENGSLKVTGKTDAMLSQGIYAKIIADIYGDEENYPPYTLEIITEETADNGHYGGGVVKKLDSPLSE